MSFEHHRRRLTVHKSTATNLIWQTAENLLQCTNSNSRTLQRTETCFESAACSSIQIPCMKLRDLRRGEISLCLLKTFRQQSRWVRSVDTPRGSTRYDQIYVCKKCLHRDDTHDRESDVESYEAHDDFRNRWLEWNSWHFSVFETLKEAECDQESAEYKKCLNGNESWKNGLDYEISWKRESKLKIVGCSESVQVAMSDDHPQSEEESECMETQEWIFIIFQWE